MKCVCGYEYEKDHWDKDENPDKGDEKFINIQGNYTMECETSQIVCMSKM